MNLDEAITFAVLAHAGQSDKGGQPYILHCLRVMLALGPDASEEDRMVAVLHDVMEDNPPAGCGLAAYNLSSRVKAMLDALTRRDCEGYFDYLMRVKENIAAVRIKIADLNDNMREDRTLEGESARRRQRKYKAAIFTLYANGLEQRDWDRLLGARPSERNIVSVIEEYPFDGPDVPGDDCPSEPPAPVLRCRCGGTSFEIFSPTVRWSISARCLGCGAEAVIN